MNIRRSTKQKQILSRMVQLWTCSSALTRPTTPLSNDYVVFHCHSLSQVALCAATAFYYRGNSSSSFSIYSFLVVFPQIYSANPLGRLFNVQQSLARLLMVSFDVDRQFIEYLTREFLKNSDYCRSNEFAAKRKQTFTILILVSLLDGACLRLCCAYSNLVRHLV